MSTKTFPIVNYHGFPDTKTRNLDLGPTFSRDRSSSIFSTTWNLITKQFSGQLSPNFSNLRRVRSDSSDLHFSVSDACCHDLLFSASEERLIASTLSSGAATALLHQSNQRRLRKSHEELETGHQTSKLEGQNVKLTLPTGSFNDRESHFSADGSEEVSKREKSLEVRLGCGRGSERCLTGQEAGEAFGSWVFPDSGEKTSGFPKPRAAIEYLNMIRKAEANLAVDMGVDDLTFGDSNNNTRPRLRNLYENVPIRLDSRDRMSQSFLDDVNQRIMKIKTDQAKERMAIISRGEPVISTPNVGHAKHVPQMSQEGIDETLRLLRVSKDPGRKPTRIDAQVSTDSVDRGRHKADTGTTARKQALGLQVGSPRDLYSITPGNEPGQEARTGSNRTTHVRKNHSNLAQKAPVSEAENASAATGYSLQGIWDKAADIFNACMSSADTVEPHLRNTPVEMMNDQKLLNVMRMMGIPAEIRNAIYWEVLDELQIVHEFSIGTLQTIGNLVQWICTGQCDHCQDFTSQMRYMATSQTEIDPDSDAWRQFECDLRVITDSVLTKVKDVVTAVSRNTGGESPQDAFQERNLMHGNPSRYLQEEQPAAPRLDDITTESATTNGTTHSGDGANVFVTDCYQERPNGMTSSARTRSSFPENLPPIDLDSGDEAVERSATVHNNGRSRYTQRRVDTPIDEAVIAGMVTESEFDLQKSPDMSLEGTPTSSCNSIPTKRVGSRIPVPVRSSRQLPVVRNNAVKVAQSNQYGRITAPKITTSLRSSRTVPTKKLAHESTFIVDSKRPESKGRSSALSDRGQRTESAKMVRSCAKLGEADLPHRSCAIEENSDPWLDSHGSEGVIGSESNMVESYPLAEVNGNECLVATETDLKLKDSRVGIPASSDGAQRAEKGSESKLAPGTGIENTENASRFHESLSGHAYVINEATDASPSRPDTASRKGKMATFIRHPGVIPNVPVNSDMKMSRSSAETRAQRDVTHINNIISVVIAQKIRPPSAKPCAPKRSIPKAVGGRPVPAENVGQQQNPAKRASENLRARSRTVNRHSTSSANYSKSNATCNSPARAASTGPNLVARMAKTVSAGEALSARPAGPGFDARNSYRLQSQMRSKVIPKAKSSQLQNYKSNSAHSRAETHANSYVMLDAKRSVQAKSTISSTVDTRKFYPVIPNTKSRIPRFETNSVIANNPNLKTER